MENLSNSSESSPRQKKDVLLKNLNITSESINLEDVQSILEKISEENVNFSKEAVEKVFNELDKDGRGIVNSENFADYLLSISNNSQTKNLFSKMVPRSVKVLEKLRKLKSKVYLNGDTESLEDIDWIISVISESNLYEPELVAHLPRPSKISGFETLAKYSQIEEAKRRENDIMVINNMRSTHSQLKTEPREFSKRRSTRLSSFISPSIFAKINMHLASSNTVDFNIFELNDLVDTKTSFYLAYDIFTKKGFFESEKVEEDVFKNFVKTIISGCNRNLPYHNDIHAGDVLQTLFTIMEQGEFQKKLDLNEIDVFSTLIAGFCHDFKHSGTNNTYHINSKSELAITYNDSSVLENYSISETFKVLNKNENNIFANFSPEEYRFSRRRVIESILATDMAFHSKLLNSLIARMENLQIKSGKNIEKIVQADSVNKVFENQQMVLSYAVHCADISSPAKTFKICDKWRERVYEEFFAQGELEKKSSLPVSLLCDRSTTNPLKSQVGFINFVVAPTFDALVNLFPTLVLYMDNISKNIEKYKELVKEEEARQGQSK